MEELYFYLALLILLSFILAISTFLRKRTKHKPEGEQNEDTTAAVRPRPLRQNAEMAEGIGLGGVRNRAMANRNARARMRAAQAQRQTQDSDSEGEIEEFEDDVVVPEGKIGKKKMAKLQMKAEKKAMRENEEREREEKREREEQKAEKRRQLEKEMEEEDARKEEEERRKREEQERKEQEEYEAMKVSFEVAEEGFEEDLDEEKQRDLLREFIDYIKRNKVVVLEDLAALFKLKTQDVISRIAELQKNGTLTGVIDDRGKFIYVSQTELESVAKFIRQRGRVSLADLAEASNTLINLNPETTAVQS